MVGYDSCLRYISGARQGSVRTDAPSLSNHHLQKREICTRPADANSCLGENEYGREIQKSLRRPFANPCLVRFQTSVSNANQVFFRIPANPPAHNPF